jgi:ribosomal protein S18 acetylase RimI-like enzyme
VIRISGVTLDALRPEEIPIAAGVAARGMRDNPGSIAMMGENPIWREQRLEPVFRWVLLSLKRPCLVARRGDAIVGVAAVSPPHQCFYRQLLDGQRALALGGMRVGVSIPTIPRGVLLPLLTLGPDALARTSRWGEAGLQNHPSEPHQHVELVAVEAGLQGLGIGSMMMEELCREMDEVAVMGYLETDKEENLRFYEKFGFEVTDEWVALDTASWSMKRPPAA